MITETVISRSLRAMFAGGVILGAQTVAAQEAPVQKVEVTGSRIPIVNVDGASPVTVLRAKDIKLDGVRSTENLLNNLPQVFADQGSNVSNGASGTSNVNLRGLGTDRTLVLVNGRRLHSGSPRSTAADLNSIPAPLIKSIEVLTGGASAIYGSDAVAGVVNFIMKDNFSGVELQFDRGFYNHDQNGGAPADASVRRNFPVPGNVGSDGAIKNASLLIGGNFDGGKGNATAFFSYDNAQALLQSQRDFSACSLGGRSTATAFNCGGSNTSFPGRFIVAGGNLTVADAAGNTRRFVTATDSYNFGPLNYYQRPSERYSFASSAKYNINDKAQVYAEANFTDYRTVAQIAPSGLFGFDASGANAIHFENPFLSQAWKTALGLTGAGTTGDALIFRRNVEGGGRQDVINNTSYRGVLGLKGTIADWDYNTWVQFGRTNYSESYRNDFSNSRIGKSLDVVTDPATGAAVCRSKLNGSDPNCAPYNVWKLGGVTQDALNYLQTPGFQSGLTQQSLQGATLGSDLGRYGWKFPWTSQGIGVSFGFEHRTDRLELATDSAFSTGDLAGQGGPTLGVAGSFSVKDYFAEANIPIVEKRPGIDFLNLKLSYRNSDYSTDKRTDSYGVNLEYAPVKSVRFRTSYSRAVRAANVVELFTPNGRSLFNLDDDPCGGATPTASAAACARTGVTAAQYGHIDSSPAGQYNQITGGNANLKPESSDSYTFGFVLNPVKDLNMTVDFFNIKVKDVISGAPATITLQQCLATGDPKFCGLITRDRLGSLWALPTAQIVATNQNLGLLKTSGIDLNLGYSYKLANLGKLDLGLTGTYLSEYKAESVPGTGVYDCAGLFGTTCGTPAPRWRHKLRTTWTTPWKLDLAFTWRHLDAVKLEATSSNPILAGPSAAIDRELGARDYFDVVGVWEFRKNMAFQFGVNNLFDRDPPISGAVSGSFGNGNTYPQVYDALGRRVFMNLTLKF
jgi:outer membrane receptor protein involved in Fe transport